MKADFEKDLKQARNWLWNWIPRKCRMPILIIVILILALLRPLIKLSHYYNSDFILRLHTAMANNRMNIYLVNGNNLIHKNDFMVYVEIINKSSDINKMYSYGVEIKDKSGNWVPLILNQWIDHYKLAHCDLNMKTCSRVIIDGGFFDENYGSTFNNTESLKGWIFLTFPPGIELSDYDHLEPHLRFKIEDYKGVVKTLYREELKKFEQQSTDYLKFKILDEKFNIN